jgi:hypothetical protein
MKTDKNNQQVGWGWVLRGSRRNVSGFSAGVGFARVATWLTRTCVAIACCLLCGLCSFHTHLPTSLPHPP